MLIVAISRNGKIIIPHGQTTIENLDTLYVIGERMEIHELHNRVYERGKYTNLQKVMIAGGGKTGYYLAEMLSEFGIAVKIIEKSKERCYYLSTHLDDVMVLHGDATDTSLLEEENLDEMDAFVAATGFDEENLLLALFVLVVILFFKHWTTGFLSSSAILIGILAGYAAAFIMGLVLPTTGVTADGVEFTKAWVLNWSKVAQASWFAVPKLMPVKVVFDARAILPVLIMFIVTAVETVGDISGVMEGGMNREPSDKELSGGVICDGLGSTFAALFGVLPNTSFSQNVGLVAMTKVVNRIALASGAVFLILCGLIPKLGALISIMPQAVLGGAAVMMFSSIVVSGIQLITKEKMTPR